MAIPVKTVVTHPFLPGLCLAVLFISALSGNGAAMDPGRGEAAFLKNCIACHADGGNEVNAEKTLSKRDRERFNIKTAEDIVRLMRNPGPGMLRFDEKAISEDNARAIAEYIIATF
jgi:cytochrome c6